VAEGSARANSLEHDARSGFHSRPRISGAGIAAALNRWPLVAVLWAAALVRIVLVLVNLRPRYAKLDFSSYYEGAFAMRHGLNPYAMNLSAIGNRLGLQTGDMFHIAETPAFLALFEPFTLLSPRAAYWTWTALSAGAFVAALIMLLWRADEMRRPILWALAALAVIYPPLAFNFIWGQSQTLVLLLLSLAMISLNRNRDAAAGIALALASLLRAFPMLLAGYLLLRGRWRALLWMAIVMAGGAAATLAVIGAPRCIGYAAGISWATAYWQTGRSADIGLGPFISRLFWYGFGWKPDARIELTRKIAVWIARMSVLAATMLATPRGNADEDPDARAFSLWVAAAIFLSPIAWPHYMVLLLIPFLNMARAAGGGRVGEGPLWMAAANMVLAALWIQFSTTLKLDFYAGFGPREPLPLMLIAEGGFAVMLLGCAAAYWFAIDGRATRNLTVAEPASVRSTLQA
jgi:hypothetical protein